MDRPRKLVVAALIRDPHGAVLLARRRAAQEHPLAWEFPGGKVEPGESPSAALAREIEEELGVRAEVGRIWDVVFHAYPQADVYLLVYPCALADAPRPVQVAALDWVPLARLGAVAVLPADETIVARLIAEG